ncbi:hypothetical protein CRG98_008085 [Punica granatum]|uniref:Uncharacterized protein n=1 Tax=Punica granatum TaxID=22663 RepID=A0A2I0KSX6_PUNGR|nr:hypothetical protein CRG98_008085 [Punica granatum]
MWMGPCAVHLRLIRSWIFSTLSEGLLEEVHDLATSHSGMGGNKLFHQESPLRQLYPETPTLLLLLFKCRLSLTRAVVEIPIVAIEADARTKGVAVARAIPTTKEMVVGSSNGTTTLVSMCGT